jgi:hypothetical protein
MLALGLSLPATAKADDDWDDYYDDLEDAREDYYDDLDDRVYYRTYRYGYAPGPVYYGAGYRSYGYCEPYGSYYSPGYTTYYRPGYTTYYRPGYYSSYYGPRYYARPRVGFWFGGW